MTIRCRAGMVWRDHRSSDQSHVKVVSPVQVDQYQLLHQTPPVHHGLLDPAYRWCEFKWYIDVDIAVCSACLCVRALWHLQNKVFVMTKLDMESWLSYILIYIHICVVLARRVGYYFHCCYTTKEREKWTFKHCLLEVVWEGRFFATVPNCKNIIANGLIFGDYSNHECSQTFFNDKYFFSEVSWHFRKYFPALKNSSIQ